MKILQLLTALAIAFIHPVAVANDEADTTRVKVGSAAPDFTCETTDGASFTLSKEKGKVVLISFFATWCGPCLQELPHLEKEILQKLGSRIDFKLIVIGREHDTTQLKKFLKEKGLAVPMAPDPKREIYGKYAEKYIPRNFVVGKDGTVKLAGVGYTADSFRQLSDTIKKELEQ